MIPPPTYASDIVIQIYRHTREMIRDHNIEVSLPYIKEAVLLHQVVIGRICDIVGDIRPPRTYRISTATYLKYVMLVLHSTFYVRILINLTAL